MAEPVLELAPHELAPNNKNEFWPQFTFRALWEGCERDFVAGQTSGDFGAHMFFRLVDEPERGNFVSARKPYHHNARLPKPLSFRPAPFFSVSSDPAIKLAAECANNWGRVFFLDANLRIGEPNQANLRLFLSQDGSGDWRCRNSQYNYFVWAPPARARDLVNLPPLHLLDYFLSLLQETESDPVLALEWAGFSDEEHNSRCRVLTRGTYAEWEHMLGLFAKSRVFWWEASSEGQVASVPLTCSLSRYTSSKYTVPFCIRYERFCDWLLNYFEPSLDIDYLKRCTAANEWSRKDVRVHTFVLPPTQHERFEALLELKAWMADKATPEEIESLLDEDDDSHVQYPVIERSL